MTNRDFHLQCRKSETNAFHRVLNALPHDKWDYSPHEKSQSASRIVWTLVGETQVLIDLIDKGEFTFGAPPEVPPAHLIEQFDKAWDTLIKKIESMDDATWNKTGRFLLRRDPPSRPALQLHPPDELLGYLVLGYVRPISQVLISQVANERRAVRTGDGKQQNGYCQ